MTVLIDYTKGFFETTEGDTVGTVTGNATLDLSTGSVFSHTPTANTTFAFTNPAPSGTSSSATLKLTGANVTNNYDVANGSYDNVSFSITSQDTAPTGIYFKPDGTKFYLSGRWNDAIYQYSLSTAWDLSTASYDNTSFSVATQATFPEDIQFKTDGTSFYVNDRANDTIYQYDLSTAWDISTASYANKSFSFTSQEGASFAIVFKSDGTKVYMVGSINDTIYQYSLSTAWDISTASYNNISFSFL
jgi:sugar lactone lactonase YvrE